MYMLLIVFIIALCICIFFHRQEHGQQHKCNKWKSIIAGYISMLVLILLTLKYMIYNYGYVVSTGFLVVLFLGEIYLLFRIRDFLLEDSMIRKLNEIYVQQLEMHCYGAGKQRSFDSESVQIRHDMKQYLTGLLGFVKAGRMADAESYILSILNDKISEQRNAVSVSGNIVVDSVVNYKGAIASKEGILIEADIFLPSILPFENYEMAAVFGNLLENALEACRKIKDRDMDRYIWLKASYSKEILLVTVRNPYIGKRKKDRGGRYISTKNNPDRHGLGLLSIKRIVSCYNGQMSIMDYEGMFQVSIVMYGIK